MHVKTGALINDSFSEMRIGYSILNIMALS